MMRGREIYLANTRRDIFSGVALSAGGYDNIVI